MVSISQSELDKILNESKGRESPISPKPQIRAPVSRKASVSRRKEFSGGFRAVTQDELDRMCKGNP